MCMYILSAVSARLESCLSSQSLTDITVSGRKIQENLTTEKSKLIQLNAGKKQFLFSNAIFSDFNPTLVVSHYVHFD